MFLYAVYESIYYKLSELGRKACKVGGKARYSYNEIRVKIRIFVCLNELLSIKHVDIYKRSSKSKMGKNYIIGVR